MVRSLRGSPANGQRVTARERGFRWLREAGSDTEISVAHDADARGSIGAAGTISRATTRRGAD